MSIRLIVLTVLLASSPAWAQIKIADVRPGDVPAGGGARQAPVEPVHAQMLFIRLSFVLQVKFGTTAAQAHYHGHVPKPRLGKAQYLCRTLPLHCHHALVKRGRGQLGWPRVGEGRCPFSGEALGMREQQHGSFELLCEEQIMPGSIRGGTWIAICSVQACASRHLPGPCSPVRTAAMRLPSSSCVQDPFTTSLAAFKLLVRCAGQVTGPLVRRDAWLSAPRFFVMTAPLLQVTCVTSPGEYGRYTLTMISSMLDELTGQVLSVDTASDCCVSYQSWLTPTLEMVSPQAAPPGAHSMQATLALLH